MTIAGLPICEWDKSPFSFHSYTFPDKNELSKNFKLLHLRWFLGIEGYESHWNDWVKKASEYPSYIFNDDILLNGQISRLWQMHQCLNSDYSEVVKTLEQWQLKSSNDNDRRCNSVMLRQYAMLYHHQYARENFTNCSEIARLAQPLSKHTDWGNATHPYDDSISMPVREELYWKYIEALAIIKAIQSGQAISDQDKIVVSDAKSLSTSFQNNTSQCFWIQSEEYDGGGGDDFEIPPYDVDLRGEEFWL